MQLKSVPLGTKIGFNVFMFLTAMFKPLNQEVVSMTRMTGTEGTLNSYNVNASSQILRAIKQYKFKAVNTF